MIVRMAMGEDQLSAVRKVLTILMHAVAAPLDAGRP